ncbi:hypothetical protein TNCV_1835581 [Trichonephila clavipes]|nr:hypothetical protein TNCV_1835581 [Trichonephila clavipes]
MVHQNIFRLQCVYLHATYLGKWNWAWWTCCLVSPLPGHQAIRFLLLRPPENKPSYWLTLPANRISLNVSGSSSSVSVRCAMTYVAETSNNSYDYYLFYTFWRLPGRHCSH